MKTYFLNAILLVLLTYSQLIGKGTTVEDSIYTLQIHKPIYVQGLSMELLHLEQDKLMGYTFSILQVAYQGRKDIILVGAGGESIYGFRYYWQGFTFRLTDPETTTNENLKMEIILKDSSNVDDIFTQKTLRKVFENIVTLMDAQEMKVGNRQMNLLKTENILINASFTIGRPLNYRKWEQKFVERIDIIGQTDGNGYHFSFVKDQEGNIMLKSAPTEDIEKGLKFSLNWFLGSNDN
jgi:hypothetical protein